MGKYSTAGRDGGSLDQVQVRNWLGYGIHKAAITGFEIKIAQTGTEQVCLNFETPKIEKEGFKADQKAVRGGKTAFKMAFGPYQKTEEQEAEFLNKIDLVAQKLGLKKEVDAISADSLVEYMTEFVAVVKMQDAYWKFIGKEYQNSKGEIKVFSEVARFGFIKSIDEIKEIILDEHGEIKELRPVDKSATIMKFDINYKHDFVKLIVSQDAASNMSNVANNSGSGDPLWGGGVVDTTDEEGEGGNDDLPF